MVAVNEPLFVFAGCHISSVSSVNNSPWKMIHSFFMRYVRTTVRQICPVRLLTPAARTFLLRFVTHPLLPPRPLSAPDNWSLGTSTDQDRPLLSLTDTNGCHRKRENKGPDAVYDHHSFLNMYIHLFFSKLIYRDHCVNFW